MAGYTGLLTQTQGELLYLIHWHTGREKKLNVPDIISQKNCPQESAATKSKCLQEARLVWKTTHCDFYSASALLEWRVKCNPKNLVLAIYHLQRYSQGITPSEAFKVKRLPVASEI